MTKQKETESEVEYLEGTSMIARKLTDEEANRELTPARFRAYMLELGEDFLDGRGGGYIPWRVFCGFLMAKEPILIPKLIKALNDRYADMLTLQDIFEEHFNNGEWSEETHNKFYGYICEFVNQTYHTKYKINRQLIQILEDKEDE